jgi:hypothetical protein
LEIYQQQNLQKKEIKEWIERKINETNRKRDTRKFYKDVRNLSNLPTVTKVVCKDKDGNILSGKKKKKQILERWQQYFEELLNPETERISSTKMHKGPINNLELEEPTYEEINEIIKSMKPNKAAGPDEMLPECIKNGGLTLKHKVHQLIVKIWKQEKIPCEWSEGILCPIYKKGD